jgi:tetratricopeptide (TPR) repeat protein
LEKVGDDLDQTAAHRAEAISLIAGQQAVSGDAATAASAATRVEEMLCDVDSDAVRAKVLHRIGIAYHHLGMAVQAFEVLTQSSELAADLHLFGLESRANAVLSNLALHERDDVEQQLRYAELAAASAEKAGDAFALQTALLQMLSAEMRRGDVEASIAIEQRLATVRTSDLASRYLTIFRSARLAWEGRFGEAHQLLSSCWSQMTFSFDRVSCGGEYALFLALDGKREESARLVKEILEIPRVPRGNWALSNSCQCHYDGTLRADRSHQWPYDARRSNRKPVSFAQGRRHRARSKSSRKYHTENATRQ